jgi:FAD/FMN-containing dehydrogenase
MLEPLSVEAIDAVVESAGADSGSSLLSVEIRQLGGAMARTSPGDGVAHLDSAYIMFAVGIAPTPELAAKTKADVERVLAAIEPWDAGRDYVNFRESESTGERLFSAERYARLAAIKADVDPDNVFRSNHEV